MEKENSRREFVKKAGLLTLGALAVSRMPAGSGIFSLVDEQPRFALPVLTYAYNALEPFIDTKTMEIHHGKHHKAYVDNLNKALVEVKGTVASLDDLVKNISKYPAAVRNNAGGHYNHSLFWTLLSPPKGTNELSRSGLQEEIKAQFGSMDSFTTKFNEAAKSVFGSGWAWLVVNENRKLEIGTTPNQDNPLMDISTFKGNPVLALDVWEHAYYLKHQNLRADYIRDWWNVVNWTRADELYSASIKR